MNKRKYPKVTGSWTYGHIIVPEKLIYIGSSDQPECCYRWQPSRYRTTELYPYIEKHGWDNIKHIIFKDGLTPEQAEVLEDLLITQAKIDGWCINYKRSGDIKKDNPKKYQQYQYYKHLDSRRVKHNEYYKNLNSTTEGRIYYRVKSFNRLHPDRKTETPMEAKNKYLEYGYIPSYIKNNDLK